MGIDESTLVWYSLYSQYTISQTVMTRENSKKEVRKQNSKTNVSLLHTYGMNTTSVRE